jgi:hypothetical protein
MSDPTTGILHIRNFYRPSDTLFFSVSSDNISCCYYPEGGQTFSVAYGETYPFSFVKTSGHGCDGEQGSFVLNMSVGNDWVGQMWFSFDSDAYIYSTDQKGPCVPLLFSGSADATLTIFPNGTNYQDGSNIPFHGTDTRPRRTLKDPLLLPKEMSNSFLIDRAGLPARYEEIAGYKRCHVEYFMRLDVTDEQGSAYFIITHSQNYGGYVALAKIDGNNVGQGSEDHEIIFPEQQGLAGKVVWWDHLDGSHPGGCNHPGNGGQIGSVAVLVGQDWTKSYAGVHAVEPVGHGSKVLFYDFSSLKTGITPSMGTPGNPSNAYMGCLTTQQLKLRPGDDGEVSAVNIEQGPDGMYYLIAGNANQTVLWKSSELVPEISKWQQVYISYPFQLNDGSAMLAWSTINNKKSLYYVEAEGYGMSFRELTYIVFDEEVYGVHVGDTVLQTSQSSWFGNGDWVADNGSLYAGAGHGIALMGAYKSINDKKTAAEVPCIQARAWYTSP